MPNKKLNVLIVDDNPEILNLMCRYLAMNGIATEGAGDGQEAVARYCSNPNKYEIILLDLQMPVMGGLEAAKQIRASAAITGHHPVIVAMTGMTRPEESPEFDLFLQKPAPYPEILATINTARKKQAAHKELVSKPAVT